jgi:hypothetical protein
MLKDPTISEDDGNGNMNRHDDQHYNCKWQMGDMPIGE